MPENVLNRVSEAEILGQMRACEFKDLKGTNGKIRVKFHAEKGRYNWFERIDLLFLGRWRFILGHR